MVNRDLDDTLILALLNPACYPHPVDSVRLIETHISWLLLAGDYVYKIKKPVDFGFLNFTDLDKRGFYCHEELRLNRRLSAGLYLDVVEIGGSTAQPVFGLEPTIEYAVKMQRFSEHELLNHLLQQDRLTSRHLHDLAATLVQFHAQLPATANTGDYGDAVAIGEPARQNFQQLSDLLGKPHFERLKHLQLANEQEFQRCLTLFAQRQASGWIRECHGDLHLGNIVLLDGRPTPFDGIEFNPALRWIDVMNDIAFLVMDLLQRQRADLAYDFLNAYLQISGDYAGMGVLRFYLGYRAMVMAKVCAIRAAQTDGDLSQCQTYLSLAERIYAATTPFLLITFGLPGCGKTTLSQKVLESYQAIRIRSDVERKRLFGLQAHESSRQELYSPEATQQTYQRLQDLAHTILLAGFSVIVDAAFLRQQERTQFKGLADSCRIPFTILAIRVDETLQRQRLRQRQNDASEADETVLDALQSVCQPLSSWEWQYATEWVNHADIELIAGQTSNWDTLERLLKRPATD